MRASLPTPLGPLITMTRGLGFGIRGSLDFLLGYLQTRARRSSERLDCWRDGMGVREVGGRRPCGRKLEVGRRRWLVLVWVVVEEEDGLEMSSEVFESWRKK
ncbi:hypothetical protein TSUD_381930 [Trifolium subterraneum]|uniref:Uncharacterized protein n=1 Tax=Trifolium subterraneum TaxID=3900 RepID=A0A2Z6LU73_TRISU|nr:hypothetical protein TSUD_381930 [Trifolium subterraneum]